MLFKVYHPSIDFLNFTCFISADGCLFFRAQDIAEMAQKKNLRRFVTQTASLRVKDVVHKGLKVPKSLLNTKIYDMERAKSVLRGTLKEERFEEMFRAAGVVVPRGIRPTFDTSKAGTVTLVDRSHTSFGQFLQKFTQDCLVFYERSLGYLTEADFDWPVCSNYGLEDAPAFIRLKPPGQKPILYKRVV